MRSLLTQLALRPYPGGGRSPVAGGVFLTMAILVTDSGQRPPTPIEQAVKRAEEQRDRAMRHAATLLRAQERRIRQLEAEVE